MSNDLEIVRRRLELLKMSREILNEEYINRRADAQSRWIKESEEAWKTRGELLPYPSSGAYPTESEIVAKAAALYQYVESGAVQPRLPEITPRDAAALSRLKTSPLAETIRQSTLESPWKTYLAPVEQPQLPAPASATMADKTPVPVAPVVTRADMTPSVAQTHGIVGPEISSGPSLQLQPQIQEPVQEQPASVTPTRFNADHPLIFGQCSNNLFPSPQLATLLPVGLSMTLPTIPSMKKETSNV